MARKSPSELVAPFDLVFEALGGFDFLGVAVDGFVIVANRFGDGLEGHDTYKQAKSCRRDIRWTGCCGYWNRE